MTQNEEKTNYKCAKVLIELHATPVDAVFDEVPRARSSEVDVRLVVGASP